MKMRTTRIFLPVLVILVIPVSKVQSLTTGQMVRFKVTDVDGRKLSALDGPTTMLVLTTRQDLDKAQLIGNRAPERCLGNPKFRMITVIQFNKSTSQAMRFVYSALVRKRVAAEANRLKPRYRAKKLTTDPRQDVHVVADFDGTTAAQLGLSDSAGLFAVVILTPDGVVLREWRVVPSAQELDIALR
ncbi:MAG TPA: hypothetical protein VGM62_13655 [Chthoniobacterales bacterium]|jgi:hypothetical protein